MEFLNGIELINAKIDLIFAKEGETGIILVKGDVSVNKELKEFLKKHPKAKSLLISTIKENIDLNKVADSLKIAIRSALDDLER